MIYVRIGTRKDAVLLSESAKRFCQKIDYKAAIPPQNAERADVIMEYDGQVFTTNVPTF